MNPQDPSYYQQPAYTPLPDANRKSRRLILAIIIGVILLIIVLIANAISDSNSPSKDYAALAAQHNELIRVVETHKLSARSLDTQNYMSRAEILLVSGKNSWIDFLAGRYGIAVSDSEQELATNPAIDAKLESAAIANRFDEDFMSEFTSEVDKAIRKTELLLESTANDANLLILNDSLAIYKSLKN